MKLSHIDLTLGNTRIFSDFSLFLHPGEVVCVTGASGRGKTTLLNLILGFVKPDRGAVEGFDGLKKGVVFQEDRLIEHMDPVDNVLLAADKSITKAQVHDTFTRVLMDAWDKPVRRLSGGQRRRVAVVRAVLAKPSLLLLDEPFKGLDDHTLEKTAEFIRKENDKATILLCVHNLREAELLRAQRMVEL